MNLGSINRDPRLDQRNQHDFYVEWFSGTGKGGQHRNKHQNSCRYYHLPTGWVETRQGRSRDANLRDARAALIARLDAADSIESQAKQEAREQSGSGQRGDKTRTIRFQDDRTVDHRNGNKCSTKEFMNGNIDRLW